MARVDGAAAAPPPNPGSRWGAPLAAAVVALAAYVATWLALGSYEVPRIAADGVAIVAVTTAVSLGLASLVLAGSRPARLSDSGNTSLIACGLLLIVPLAFPVGVASAWFLVTGVLDPPQSLLQAFDVSHAWQVALAYGFLVGLPFFAGCLFLAIGIRRRPLGSGSTAS